MPDAAKASPKELNAMIDPGTEAAAKAMFAHHDRAQGAEHVPWTWGSIPEEQREHWRALAKAALAAAPDQTSDATLEQEATRQEMWADVYLQLTRSADANIAAQKALFLEAEKHRLFAAKLREGKL